MSAATDQTAAFALCALFIVRQVVSAGVLGPGQRRPVERIGGTDILVFLWAGYVSLAVLALRDATLEGMTVARWISFFALSLGSTLRVAALTKIRPYYWPSIAFFPDQRVVHEGPYRLFAHPLYLGLAVETLALATLSGRMAAAFVASALVVAMQVQIRREETVLEQRFGAAYREYREGTLDIGDCVPRPWSRTGARPPLPELCPDAGGEAESHEPLARPLN